MGDSLGRIAYRKVLLRGHPERRRAPSNLQSRFYPRSRFCSALLHILRTCLRSFCARSGSRSILGPAPADSASKPAKVPTGTLAGDQCRPVRGTLGRCSLTSLALPAQGRGGRWDTVQSALPVPAHAALLSVDASRPPQYSQLVSVRPRALSPPPARRLPVIPRWGLSDQ